MKRNLFLIFIALILLSSCATIFTGTKDYLHFESNPPGAKVLIDGLEMCKTPCTLGLKRSLNDKVVEIKLDDYQTKVILLDREFNTVSIINLGNLLAWAIDAATGSLMKYGRKLYEVELEKEKVSLLNIEKIKIDTQNKTVDIYKFAKNN